MYIALKWLLSLSTLLWFGLCVCGIFRGKHMDINKRDFNLNTIAVNSTKNISVLKTDEKTSQNRASLLLLYCTGVAVTSIFSIINFERRIICKVKLKFESFYPSVYSFFMSMFKSALFKFIVWSNYVQDLGSTLFKGKIISPPNLNNVVNITLLKRIKGLIEERRKLGKLLFITIQENKNLNLKYHLETLAKNRYALYIDDSQRQIKSNRSHYLYYQNLYLMSNQENIFLKSRLEKVVKEKQNTEKNLLSIIYQVYLSKNNVLKDYCSQFIVRTKETLIKSDVKEEVLKLIKKYQSFPNADTKPYSSNNVCKYLNFGYHSDQSSRLSTNYGPQSRGEYVWAVKDKDGMIQKLYEYKMDFNSGAAVRRLREYSVYYVKDALLAHHRTLASIDAMQEQWISTVTKHFLTGSHVFQRFLQNYPNIRKPTPSLLEI